jgi:hypothetical protein
MKLLMFFLITILTGGLALAQELPEPIAPEFTYTFQILFGTISIPTPLWIDIVPKSIEVVAGTAISVHNYKGKIGDNKWESVAMDSTMDNPKKIVAIINITELPNGGFFNFYRIRSRASATIDGIDFVSDWSPPSFWVLVLNFNALYRPVSLP